MGRHRPDIETNEDGDTVRIRGSVPDVPSIKEDKGTRTFERDSGGIQGFEYFGVDTRDEES